MEKQLTNAELSTCLSALAQIYLIHSTRSDCSVLPEIYTSIHTDTKQQLIDVLHAVGGKFKKSVSETSVVFRSDKIPSLRVSIWRDKVCKKIVKYECEPILSKEDEVEIEEEYER